MKKMKNKDPMEKLRVYIRKSLHKKKNYRIVWPTDLYLADVRNTPLLSSRKRKLVENREDYYPER